MKDRQHFYFRKKATETVRPCDPYFHRFYGAKLICECGDRRLVQNGDRMRLVKNEMEQTMITESRETITIFRDERGNVKGFILTEEVRSENYPVLTQPPVHTSFKYCGGGQPFAWFDEDIDGAKILAGIREELGI